ncbi:MAG: glutathione S-transferase family protein [Dongiaceae bacterium]
MFLLYHFPLHPFCREVRLVLREKALDFTLQAERPGQPGAALLALSPVGELPVLVEPDGAAIADSRAIGEYLEETQPAPDLLGRTALQRAETRRLVGWFGARFHREVTANLLDQKILRRLTGRGPDSAAIRAGHAAIGPHLDYVAWLSDRRTWLAGDQFSLADIAAAAQLSTLDYLGDVPWERHPEAKDWYARVKSRPSFRPLLADVVPGVAPAPHYADLDF